MSALASVYGSKQVTVERLSHFSPEQCKQKIDDDVRKTFFNTLTAMKTAHFKTYFEIQSTIKETEEGVALPRLFGSFHPCPLKLILIESFKKPLDLLNLPEIFQGFEVEFTLLYREYQKLDPQAKQDLLDSLIDDVDVGSVAFNEALDTFLEKIETGGTHAARISFLLRTFETDVLEIKELVALFAFSGQIERVGTFFNVSDSCSESSLLMSIFVFFASAESLSFNIASNKKYVSALCELKKKYHLLDAYSQYLLREDIKSEKLVLKHDPLAREVLFGAKKIASEIILDRVF